jgi:hypothetical protein
MQIAERSARDRRAARLQLAWVRHAFRMATRTMSNRMASFVIIPAVAIGAGLAFYGVEHDPYATGAPRWIPASPAQLGAVDDMQPSENGEALPPNHPPIGALANGETLPPNHPHVDAMGSPPGVLPAAGDPPAIAWKMPPTWQEAPNPSTMRLATYHAPGGVEISVSRAGGDTDANIQRWIAQFDEAGRDGRVEKTVRGIHVVTVDVAGTYVGGGMSGGGAEPRPDWALVGAVVESQSPSYFFKMTGPATAVRAARPAFERIIDSISPA